MRPIFELDEILRQDAHEDSLVDGPNEFPVEQQTTPSTPVLSTLPAMKLERQRNNSDSSIASMDGDDNTSTLRTKKQHNKNHLGMISLSTSLNDNQPQPLFANDIELYGTQLVNPLLLLSSTLNS
jgi:hypothetical protein